MYKNKVWKRSDYYFNHKSAEDAKAKMFGMDVLPVDLQGGGVFKKSDKWGMNSATTEDIEHNIQERFSLDTPDEENDDYEY